jgi:integrase
LGWVERRRRRLSDGTLGEVAWRARYRDANGRPRSRSFARKFDAERFLEANGADMQRGEWVDPTLRRSSFADWADAWWATTAKLRPNTRRGYWLLLTNHVLPYFGTARLGSIDYLDVERFIAEKLKSGHGPKQVRQMLSVLSLILKCAVKANARRDNPAAGHELRVPHRRVFDVPMLTMDQASSLVEHTSDHYKSAMWLLVFTGMRPAELCGLRVRDVDLVRHVVHVRRTWSPVPGFDGGSWQYIDGPVKSDAGKRSIPIPGWLCEELAADLAWRAPLEPDDPLILNKQGRAVNRDTFRARVVRPALHAAGLPDELRTYDIRHSHASLLIHDGANVLAVAQRMGHTDPGVTLRVYGHLFEGVQEELTERLDLRRRAATRLSDRPKAPVVELHRRDAHGR